MQRVTEGEQQRHGDRLGGRRDLAHRVCHARHLGVGERQQRTVRSHPLGDADHALACEWRRGVVTRQIVQIGAVLAPQPEQVLESGGRDQHDVRPAALEQRVGSDGRAVNEDVDGVAFPASRFSFPEFIDRSE